MKEAKLKISEMEAQLKELRGKHGDLPVYYYEPCCCAKKTLLAEEEIRFCEKGDWHMIGENKVFKDDDGITIGNQL